MGAPNQPNRPFATGNLSREEIKLVTSIYQELGYTYTDVAFDPNYHPPLTSFESVNAFYTDVRSGPAIRLPSTRSATYLYYPQLTYPGLSTKYGSYSHQDRQTWGVTLLSRPYGHLLIRPETMLDKVRELLHHAELDFTEDAAFSRRFYVLSNEEEKARHFLDSAIRRAILDLALTDFTIEIIDKLLLIGDYKKATVNTALEIAGFLEAVGTDLR